MNAPGPLIEIVPYDPAWPVRFAAERDRLQAALGATALSIDHNGSTSVPGMPAKPVIDIQISVAVLEPMDRYRIPLVALGYHHVPHADDAVCPFFHRPKCWPHTFHIHVVRSGGDEELRTLAFRDYLREHPGVMEEYAGLKRGLAQQHVANDAEARERYSIAKGPFVERIIALARAAGYPRR